MTLALRGIHVGDCRELLRKLPDESVHCVVTSPPYWGLRDYGLPPLVWGGDHAHQHSFSAELQTAEGRAPNLGPKVRQVVEQGTCACGAWSGALGLEPTPYMFVEHIVEVFREVRRVLRPDGTVWINLGDSYATGAYSGAGSPGGGLQGARWRGDVDRLRDVKRGYRGDRLANGRKDQAAVLRKKTRATRDGTHAGKHTGIAARGPMLQPNRMPIPGLKPKDLVGVPWRVAFALQDDGWWLRMDNVWAKPNPMPESVKDRTTRAHEYVFLLTKSAEYFYDGGAIAEPMTAPEASTPSDLARAFTRRRAIVPAPHQGPAADADPSELRMRNKRSVWTIASQPYDGAHFATFPTKLVEPCILAGCPAGGLVLDPFGGSGTVGEVAEALGRRWILFDLNAEYAELARMRTKQLGCLVAPAAAALEAAK